MFLITLSPFATQTPEKLLLLGKLFLKNCKSGKESFSLSVNLKVLAIRKIHAPFLDT